MNYKPIACPKCGQKISIPFVRETVHVTCPKCKTEWDWPERSKVAEKIRKLKPINWRGLFSRIPRRQLFVIKLCSAIALLLIAFEGTFKFITHYRNKAQADRYAAKDAAAAMATNMDVSAVHATADPAPHAPTTTLAETPVMPAPLPGKATSPEKAPRPVWDGAPEIAMPKTGDGAFFFDSATATSRIKFFPRTEQENVVIKFLNATNSQLVCWVFVREGETAQVQIPSGVYKCRIASGSHWYGETNLLGPYASYVFLPNVITIPYDAIYTIDCRPGLNSSLHETPMEAKEF